MFVSEEVNDDIQPPFSDHFDGIRHAEFRSTLDSFVLGHYLSVSEKPFQKPGTTMLARVHPVHDKIWDIRCTAPHPGIRCLGAFAGLDTFVALTWNYRENIDAGDWSVEIERCKAEWKKLFGEIKRFKGENINEYLSDNFRVF